MKAKALAMLLCALLSSSGFAAQCTTNARGTTTCSNGENAARYNPNTGNAAKAQTNSVGVTTVQTGHGGEVKMKNGKGVYKAPNGQTCYKTANSQGCR
ncbi:hypothetical protein [Burkholderia sp. GbtcB21]|uniref:hypothetical protein n=1 Tax=Burkholderia sp. GbtcB21 TaxID=2824766 RepID=UPI001C2FCD10|nr:hypothetical protein [Burkholderia sp. GbtcB21]